MNRNIILIALLALLSVGKAAAQSVTVEAKIDSLQILIGEQAVHVRECRRAAADVVLVGLVRLRLHHGHHLAVEIVQILIRDAHALDDVVDLLDLQLAGALQA